jgi:hypothetical protein
MPLPAFFDLAGFPNSSPPIWVTTLSFFDASRLDDQRAFPAARIFAQQRSSRKTLLDRPDGA